MVSSTGPGSWVGLWFAALVVVFVGVGCGAAIQTPRVDDLRDRNGNLRPDRPVDEDELIGEASWYGERHHGRTTANGERFDMDDFTAAHRTLPFNTVVRVTDPRSRKSVVVRINDRGPYHKGRIIDLSRAAADDLDMIRRGKARVELEILVWGDGQTFHHL